MKPELFPLFWSNSFDRKALACVTSRMRLSADSACDACTLSKKFFRYHDINLSHMALLFILTVIANSSVVANCDSVWNHDGHSTRELPIAVAMAALYPSGRSLKKFCKVMDPLKSSKTRIHGSFTKS